MRRVWVTSPSYEAAVRTLVALREDAGLTQRELAGRLGKPRSFVSKIEGRERRIDIVELVAYARALGMTPEALVSAVASGLSDTLVF